MTPEEQKELRQLSAEKKYSIKHRRLAYLISQREHEWDAEHDGGGNMLAVTHRPTKFRIHIPDDIPGLPEKFRRIAKRNKNMQIAAGAKTAPAGKTDYAGESKEKSAGLSESAARLSGVSGGNLFRANGFY